MANSKRKCRHCKGYKLVTKGEVLNGGFYCNEDCKVNYAMESVKKKNEKARKALLREKKKKEKENRAAVRELDRTKLKWQHKHTQREFNRMRVLEEKLWFKNRGLEPYCISCGKTDMDWCCGHYKTVGAHGGLRYKRMNTCLQCNRYCNMGLSANIGGNKTTRGYKKGIIERFGDVAGRIIMDFCETETKVKRWEWQELEGMRSGFSKRIRELTIKLEEGGG